jgi:hypothetical protein
MELTVFWDVAPCSPVEITTTLHGATSQTTDIFKDTINMYRTTVKWEKLLVDEHLLGRE